MFTIRYTSGRTLGTVTPDESAAETLRRVRALTGRTIPVGGPAAGRPRKRVPWARVTLAGLAGVAVFGFAFGAASGPNTAPAAPTPAAPATPSTPAGPETLKSWHRVEHNGDVISDGRPVDNVYDGSSPTRARFLAVFAANRMPVSNQNSAVSEGITFCEGVRAGRTAELRELFDSRADEPQFGTGARRATLAAAAVEYLCPAYDQ